MDRDDYLARARRAAAVARCRPEMFVGSAPTAHLAVFREALKVACMSEAFASTRMADVAVDGCKIRLRVWSDGLSERYARLVDWGAQENILEAINWLHAKLFDELNGPETLAQEQGYVGLSALGGAALLARTALVGLRATGQFWWQPFTDGVPDGPLSRAVTGAVSGGSLVGLCIAHDLPRDLFPGLPYRVDEVESYLADVPGCYLSVLDEPIGEVRSLGAAFGSG